MNKSLRLISRAILGAAVLAPMVAGATNVSADDYYGYNNYNYNNYGYNGYNNYYPNYNYGYNGYNNYNYTNYGYNGYNNYYPNYNNYGYYGYNNYYPNYNYGYNGYNNYYPDYNYGYNGYNNYYPNYNYGYNNYYPDYNNYYETNTETGTYQYINGYLYYLLADGSYYVNYDGRWVRGENNTNTNTNTNNNGNTNTNTNNNGESSALANDSHYRYIDGTHYYVLDNGDYYYYENGEWVFVKVATSETANSEAGSETPATSEVANSEAGSETPATSEAANSEAGSETPATSEAANSEAGSETPATSEAANSEAGSETPATSEAANSEAGSETPATSEAANSEAGSETPATSEAANSEAGSEAPATSETVTSEAGSTAPTTSETTNPFPGLDENPVIDDQPSQPLPEFDTLPTPGLEHPGYVPSSNIDYDKLPKPTLPPTDPKMQEDPRFVESDGEYYYYVMLGNSGNARGIDGYYKWEEDRWKLYNGTASDDPAINFDNHTHTEDSAYTYDDQASSFTNFSENVIGTGKVGEALPFQTEKEFQEYVEKQVAPVFKDISGWDAKVTWKIEDADAFNNSKESAWARDYVIVAELKSGVDKDEYKDIELGYVRFIYRVQPEASAAYVEVDSAKVAFDQINAERKANGLSELTWSEDLYNNTTLPHAQNISVSYDSDGIVARRETDGKAVANQWLNSGLRDLFLSPDAKEAAVACVIGGDGTYYWSYNYQ